MPVSAEWATVETITVSDCPCCGVGTCCCPGRSLPRRLALTIGPAVADELTACDCLDGVTLNLDFKATLTPESVALHVWATDSYACVASTGCAIRVQFFLTCGRAIHGAPTDDGELMAWFDQAAFDAMTQDGGLGDNPACPDPPPGIPCGWTLMAYVARSPDFLPPEPGCDGCGADFNLGWVCAGNLTPDFSCDPFVLEFGADIEATQCELNMNCNMAITVTEMAA